MITYKFECEECDSIYSIEADKNDLTDEPQFCTVCANPIVPIEE